MKNLWTIAAYPTAALAGYFIALGTRDEIAEISGLDPLSSTVGILIISGLVVGFLVDEVIPAYVHEVREEHASKGVGGGDDFGGDDLGGNDLGGDDFDFDN